MKTYIPLTLCLAALCLTVPVLADSPKVPDAPDVTFRNALVAMPGVTSGGQPTAEELQAAAEKGYKTVINLRMPEEQEDFDEKAAVEGLGMAYVSIPIAGADGITEENARKLHEALGDATERPVLLHCGSGNRIGALFALIAHTVDGEDAETSLQFGLERGLTRLEPVVRERLGLPPPPAEK